MKPRTLMQEITVTLLTTGAAQAVEMTISTINPAQTQSH